LIPLANPWPTSVVRLATRSRRQNKALANLANLANLFSHARAHARATSPPRRKFSPDFRFRLSRLARLSKRKEINGLLVANLKNEVGLGWPWRDAR
jgi:hypothetical protein